MATGDLSINVAYKGALTFVNAEGGGALGPATASVSLDNSANGSAALDADGQGYTVTLTALGAVNLVYSGTNELGAAIPVPNLPLNGVDTVAVSGSFGDPTPA